MEIKCVICGKIFRVRPYRAKTAKACSKKCVIELLNGYKKTQKWYEANVKAIRRKHPMKGRKHRQESIVKMRKSHTGHPAPKTAFTTDRVKGENNVNWKGGVTPLNEKIRKSKVYKEWRIAVMKRDCFCCRVCGFYGYVNAHHIKKFNSFDELRFDVNNGITLCPQCHRITQNREYLFETFFQGILEKGFNSAEISSETTPSQQERLRKALWACVEVIDE